MIRLCRRCKERNKSGFPECQGSECHVCRGASAGLDAMAEKAAAMIAERNSEPGPGNPWKSFSISTNIPRDMMAREEEVWDFGAGASVKDDFNRRLAEGIIGKTGLDYSVLKADGALVFDIGKGEVRLENADIFIFGRYRKLRAGLAQTEWTCRDCGGKGCAKCGYEGVKYESVESMVGEAAKRIYGAKDAELHASGREDVDALNLAGRPFVLELRKPAEGKLDLGLLQNEVNGAGEGVEISDLGYVSNSEVALVSDSHFDKGYEAEIEVEGGLAEGDEAKILALSGETLSQRTPHRVKHRRSDLVRKRRILDLRVLGGSPPRIYVYAEAGTYIKEFISGDEGRTMPSVSSALGKKAKCIKLSVVEISDGFIGDVIGGK